MAAGREVSEKREERSETRRNGTYLSEISRVKTSAHQRQPKTSQRMVIWKGKGSNDVELTIRRQDLHHVLVQRLFYRLLEDPA